MPLRSTSHNMVLYQPLSMYGHHRHKKGTLISSYLQIFTVMSSLCAI